VVVATAETADIPVTIRTVGNVEPVAQVMLRPQVAGQVVEIPVEEGTEVQAGQTLIVLDERPWSAALKKSESDLSRDRVMAEDLRRQANQYAVAIASGAGNKIEADTSEARAGAAEAQVGADEAAVSIAKLNLEYCRLKAPFAGRLGPLLVKKGAIVKEDETDLVDLVQIRPIEVGFSIAEQQVEAIRAGQSEAPLTVTADPQGPGSDPAHGVVSFIDNKVDQETGTIRLKARFANEDERLWPGRFVDVILTMSQERGVVVVPAAAVQASQRGSAVWVVKSDGTAELRPVAVKRVVEGRSVIESGIAAGETVVTDGQLRLAPGIRVDAKREQAAAPDKPKAGV
jgi:multidrug efflux system membrane fusion protein